MKPGETVGEFVNKHITGKYIITIPDHITVAKDGVIYDTFDCRDRMLLYVWKVKS